jgi:hypothetical protein
VTERGTREEPNDRRRDAGELRAAEEAAVASYRRLLARASEVVTAAEATGEPELRPEPAP